MNIPFVYNASRRKGEIGLAKAFRVMKLLIAVMTAVVCALFIYEAADIYFTGVSPENFSAPGVAINQMYTRPDVAARLRTISPALIVYAVLCAGGLVLKFLVREREKPRAIKPAEVKTDVRRVRLIRVGILVLGVLFVGLGVWNGGLWDVLVKAVNICTECIGLG